MLSSLFSYERHVTCREGYIDFQKHRNFMPTYEQVMRYFPWCLSLLSLVGCRPIYLYRHQGDGLIIFSNGAIGFSYNPWKCTVKIWTTFLHVWPALSAGLDAPTSDKDLGERRPHAGGRKTRQSCAECEQKEILRLPLTARELE
jgi:hypothetical protein